MPVHTAAVDALVFHDKHLNTCVAAGASHGHQLGPSKVIGRHQRGQLDVRPNRLGTGTSAREMTTHALLGATQ